MTGDPYLTFHPNYDPHYINPQYNYPNPPVHYPYYFPYTYGFWPTMPTPSIQDIRLNAFDRTDDEKSLIDRLKDAERIADFIQNGLPPEETKEKK